MLQFNIFDVLSIIWTKKLIYSYMIVLYSQMISY
jgi:hypothetical protein